MTPEPEKAPPPPDVAPPYQEIVPDDTPRTYWRLGDPGGGRPPTRSGAAMTDRPPPRPNTETPCAGTTAATERNEARRERDQARADWDQAIVAWREAQRERDEARRMYEDAREQFDITARERDEARAEAARYREALERLTKAVHNWNVALDGDDSAEIHAVSGELEAALIAADEALGGSDD